MNTPDTESELNEHLNESFNDAMIKYLDYLGLKQSALSGRPSIDTSYPEFYSVRKPFNDLIREALTSRDTYWKERVEGERERYKKLLRYHYEHYGIESVKELITNKDNLK